MKSVESCKKWSTETLANRCCRTPSTPLPGKTMKHRKNYAIHYINVVLWQRIQETLVEENQGIIEKKHDRI